MSDALLEHFAPFAEAQGLTIGEVRKLIFQYSPRYPQGVPAWRAIGLFCETYPAIPIDGIARILGRPTTAPALVQYVKENLLK